MTSFLRRPLLATAAAVTVAAAMAVGVSPVQAHYSDGKRGLCSTDTWHGRCTVKTFYFTTLKLDVPAGHCAWVRLTGFDDRSTIAFSDAKMRFHAKRNGVYVGTWSAYAVEEGAWVRVYRNPSSSTQQYTFVGLNPLNSWIKTRESFRYAHC